MKYLIIDNGQQDFELYSAATKAEAGEKFIQGMDISVEEFEDEYDIFTITDRQYEILSIREEDSDYDEYTYYSALEEILS